MSLLGSYLVFLETVIGSYLKALALNDVSPDKNNKKEVVSIAEKAKLILTSLITHYFEGVDAVRMFSIKFCSFRKT